MGNDTTNKRQTCLLCGAMIPRRPEESWTPKQKACPGTYPDGKSAVVDLEERDS